MGVAASKREVTSAGRTWGKGTLVHCRGECRWVQPLWKTVWRVLRKLKMDLPFCPAIPLLGFHLKESQALAWKDSCAPVFPARHLPSQRCRRGHGPDGPGPVVDEEEAVCSDSSTRPVPGKSSNTGRGSGTPRSQSGEKETKPCDFTPTWGKVRKEETKATTTQTAVTRAGAQAG